MTDDTQEMSVYWHGTPSSDSEDSSACASSRGLLSTTTTLKRRPSVQAAMQRALHDVAAGEGHDDVSVLRCGARPP